MKKISAIVLAIVLVMMASVPFCASADTTFTVSGGEVTTDVETITVTIGYETSDEILNGKYYVTYDPAKLELVVPKKTSEMNGIAGATFIPNTDKAAEGEFQAGFMVADPMDASGTMATLTFKLLAPAVGDVYDIALEVTEWATQDADLAKGNPIKGAAQVKVVAPTTTTTTTTTTVATTTTTKKAAAAGEATPWALLATVTVAGAALVVLSTKKSK